VSRTYDGTTAASGSGSVAVLWPVPVRVNWSTRPGNQFFLDKNVGTGNKVVRATGVHQGQFQCRCHRHYNISYVDNTASTISPAALTVTAQSVSRTYDGTTVASGSGNVGTLAGSGAGELVNTAGNQFFLDKNIAPATRWCEPPA
jgi:hypothetical protein